MAVITGTSSSELLNGTVNDDEIRGLAGNDMLKGGGGDDTLIGGSGADSLVGGAGSDSLVGGGGNDIYTIDAADIVFEDANAGIDTVQAAFSYKLLVNFENLVLLGSSAIDGTGNTADNAITGNSARNLLSGLAGDDTLNGGGGNDTLSAGAGNDLLNGGAGNDVLIFDPGDTRVDGGGGTDTLRVTGGGVVLDLTVVPNTVYRDIEVIDLTGTGNNSLMLARSDVIANSSTTDTLRMDANVGDVVTTAGAGWLHTLDVKIGVQTYAQYANGLATLQVDIDANRSGIDTTVSVIAVSSLNGMNGFRLDGVAPDDNAYAVSGVGDVNGDGFDDLIIGARSADPNGNVSGASYVVFGKATGFAASINLSTLDGANGFRLAGAGALDFSGYSVSGVGDVNGDGFDDLIVGGTSLDLFDPGRSYVVFGKASGFVSSFSLSTLNGTNGFRLDGVEGGEHSGCSVNGAGDVNGDGFDDLVVGAFNAYRSGINAGVSYVVFGKASGFASGINLSMLNGANGFQLSGEYSGGYFGRSVSGAGDVNNDGFDDLIVGAPFARNESDFGASYVVFGKASGFAANVDLSALDGSNGFRLDGPVSNDHAGRSVSGAGDVNHDGFSDLIVGAYYADPNGSDSGASYVVFGKASGFASSIDLTTLDGANGFRLEGGAAGDHSGYSVSGVGDVNGDSFDDILVGAFGAEPNGTFSGASYVVFGRASGFASSINLSTLNGVNGFRLEGSAAGDFFGQSVSAAGDVNGDGFSDLIIGAKGGDLRAGASYVVFGGDFTGAVTFLGTSGANLLIGTSAPETFVSGQGNDVLAGGGGADVFNAGAGNDLMRVSSTTFAEVDGGSGADTLSLLGGNRMLDLITLANNKISGIETIDITGGGDNTLELAALDLFNLSDTTNQLTVNGNAGDTVNLHGAWSAGAMVGDYDTYTQGAAKMLIDSDISLFFV